MTERLAPTPSSPRRTGGAHESYVAERERQAVVPEIAGVSAGGMPDRVKCLHVLVAHALAAGPGVEPARRRGAGAAAAVVGRRPVRRAGSEAERHRTGRERRGWPPSTAAPTRSGCSSPTSTRPPARWSTLDRTMRDRPARRGRRPDRPAVRRGAGDGPSRRCDAYAARIRELGARAGPVRRDVGVAGRGERATSSSRACATRLGVDRRGGRPATRRPRCRSPARPRAAAAASRRRTWSSTSAAAPPSSSSATRARCAARSVDIGCVRITERRLHTDPPTAAEVAAARADIEAARRRWPRRVVPLARRATLVGLAGSVTTLAAMDAEPARVRRDASPTTTGSRPRPCARSPRGCSAMTRAERRAHPGHAPGPGRRDRRRGAGPGGRGATRPRLPEVLVSEHDILDGIAWSLAGWH